tara:strand:- start:8950 stop:9183 length:234 start_codon:yes stop_codon:yes gene_type:complete
MRLRAAIEVRNGRGGDPRGPRGEGASFGISEKLMEKDWFGNRACDGRGEHGMTGLGNWIGDDVGDGQGEEYAELASE